MVYTVKYIAELIEAEIHGLPQGEIKHLSIDARAIENSEESLFFALSGSQKNGHDYIFDAYKKGVRNFVVSEIKNDFLSLEGAAYLKVKDTLEALQKLAGKHRKSFDLKVIAITGSNGKTIVKEWLSICLADNFSIVKSPKSYNSQIGVPLSLWAINNKHTLGIFEAGISQANEMKSLERIIHPELGILTHIGTAHIENFNSKELLLHEKLNVFKRCETIIFSSSKPWVYKEIIKRFPSKKCLSYGKTAKDTLQIIEADKKENYTQIKAVFKQRCLHFKVPFTDRASVDNTLTVILTLLHLGFSQEKINEKIQSLYAVRMRLEFLEGINQNLLISDIYNSDWDSVKIALEVLAYQEYANKSLVLTEFNSFNPELYTIIKKLNLKHLVLIGNFQKEETLAQKTYYFDDTVDFITRMDFSLFSNEAILFKGARRFELEKAVKKMVKRNHETVLEINLENLIHNLNYFKRKLNPQTKIMVMVKAFSYGSGVYEIANLLKFHQVDYLGVAYPDEGIALRNLGISMPIMVMNAIHHSHSAIIEHRLEPEIFNFRVLHSLVGLLKSIGLKKYPIHLKLETGMHRLGFETSELATLKKLLKENEPWLQVQSIFSHLATADIPEEKAYVLHQVRRFNRNYNAVVSVLDYLPIKHILNSSGISHFSKYQFDMVRLGIGIYGYNFDHKVRRHLKSIATLKSTITQIKYLRERDTVGYGRRFKAPKTTRIATIPIGYADGLRRLQGKGIGYVKIHHQKAPIIGNICMDMTMIDVSNISCEEGDEVILIGKSPSLEEVAAWQQTIPYEVLTSISSRVKRIYYKD